MAQKYYAYTADGSSGVTDNWPECEANVKGIPGAKFKSFSTEAEAQEWLDLGADYKVKQVGLETGIYFDAGTGAGNGVEISVTDETGKSLLCDILDKSEVNSRGFHLLGKEVTNNFGELLACKYAIEISLKNNNKKIFGDSKLVIDFWSKGFIKAQSLEEQTVALSKEVAKLRRDFEKNGGVITQISGGRNPADLGFHK